MAVVAEPVEKKVVAVSVPKQLSAQVEEIAMRESETTSTILRRLLRKGLEVESRRGDR